MKNIKDIFEIFQKLHSASKIFIDLIFIIFLFELTSFTSIINVIIKHTHYANLYFVPIRGTIIFNIILIIWKIILLTLISVFSKIGRLLEYIENRKLYYILLSLLAVFWIASSITLIRLFI
jgi:hypothetical protein